MRIAARFAASCLSLSFATFALAQQDDAPPPVPIAPEPYPALTDTRREVANFNVEPVRAIAFGSDGSLYSINVHASQLVWHFNLDGVPDLIGQTVHNPVSLALWGNNRVVVAGAGSHALALHDRTTFDVLDVLQLPSEPADLVIDTDLNCAFVACQGANVVVKVDLATFAIVTEYPIPAERPRFLFFDAGGAGASDNRVNAAAFLSGNGTLGAGPAGPGERIFPADPLALGFPTLSPPDEDLFSIDVNGTGAAAVTAVKRRVGTLLTAHGKHQNGAYWALNVNALNADPNRLSEPLLRGDFVRNQVWRGALATPANFALASEQTDLDAGTGGYSAATATAFPFGIAFGPAGDPRVFITSPLDDLVSIRDAAGVELARITNFTAGSVPLDVELWPFSNDVLFTYCFGTNEVVVQLVSNPLSRVSLSLGFDPTPEPIRAGREIWYDGHRSANARTSCNSCHPGGKSDFLGWQISDEPSDRKDVMVTQSLLSIEDTFPYHWRGERALIDFNGAFVDLLGGAAKLSEGPNSEFEDFQAFVFSLQAHANPREHIDRVLPQVSEVVAVRPTGNVMGNPAQGVAPFRNVIGFNGQTCEGCHVAESGSNGDYIGEVNVEIPTAFILEVPHLRELRHKDQPVVTIVPGFDRTRSGWGIAHNGGSLDLLDFIDAPVFQLTGTEPQDVTAFVRRFDHGIAPAAHAVFMFDVNHQANATPIQNILIAQAVTALRWIDVAAFGKFVDPFSGTTRVGRWWFNPATNLFDCHDSNVPSQPFSTFVSQAAASQCALAFVGLPPGNGFRFALDPDHDRLIDGKERTAGTDPWDPDSDNDGQPDGYEVRLGSNPLSNTSLGSDTGAPTGTVTIDFKNASLAKLEVRANEEVTVSAAFSSAGGPVRTSLSPVLGELTTLALQRIDPSTPATAPLGAFASIVSCTLTLTDRSANVGTIVMTPFTAGEQIHPLGVPAAGSPLIVSALSGTKSSVGTSMTINGQVQLHQRFFDAAGVNGSAATNRVVVLQVIRENAANTNLYSIDSTFTTVGGTVISALDVANTVPPIVQRTLPPTVLPGPFLLTPVTTASGLVPFDATVLNLNVNERVRIRVVAIVEPHPSLAGVFVDFSLALYNLPPTPIDERGLEFQFP